MFIMQEYRNIYRASRFKSRRELNYKKIQTVQIVLNSHKRDFISDSSPISFSI